MKRGQNVGKMEGEDQQVCRVGRPMSCRCGGRGLAGAGAQWRLSVAEARRGMLSESRETAVGGWV